MKAISDYFRGGVVVGEVRTTEFDIIDRFNITMTPSLVALGKEPIEFKKRFYIDEIDMFIKKFMSFQARGEDNPE